MFRPDEELSMKIDQWIKDNTDAFVSDLRRLVAVPSVSQENEGGYPFGRNCAKVLDEAGAVAAKYGFTVENHEYYCGSLLVKGRLENPKRIGLFAHLDVVPLGEDWQYPPLGCTLKDGYLIGRGVGDNKGPGVCGLYALRFLKEQGIKLDNDVVLYLGLSEETGMSDIDYFCKTQKVPDFGLVTDTNFPVCYGEKGLMRAKIRHLAEGNLVGFHAGSVVNVIPSKAEAVVRGISQEEARKRMEKNRRITVEEDKEGVRITASGISRHAAFPEGSLNAVHVLAEALDASGILTGSSREAVKALSVLTGDDYGHGAGIPFEDQESGKLTCIGSLARLEDGVLSVSFDIRYPVTVKGEDVEEAFQERVNGMGFSYEAGQLSPPAYVPLSHPYIPLLSSICDYVQGKHYEPYTMGGGTYSRHLPAAIGFGPGVPDAPNPFGDGHGQGHQPDECVPLDMLLKGIKTYILSLVELDKVL